MIRSYKAGILALNLAALCTVACSTSEDGGSRVVAVTQAIESADCGFSVTAEVHGVSKKGFNAKVTVTNVSGSTATVFGVLVRAGGAQLLQVAHGSSQVVDGGYLISPLGSLEDSLLDPGQSYSFELKFDGTYTELTPYVISANGTNCDQAAPTVALATSGKFFTADGSLTLTAEATDNVAIRRVVFLQDDVVIGEDTSAPYSLQIPVNAALNGRHRYTATAFDLTNNAASNTTRVLVSIGNKFFGMAATTAADYANFLEHFDQLTPGNAGKWGSVEGTRDQLNFTELDTAYQFAKTNHIPFKLHTLVWGQQQPSWLGALTAEEQLVEIEQWMTALAERYPDAQLIDVVNEPLHAPPSYAAALGGAGTTGWDWVIRSFELARAYFPNSELILNDYSILSLASSTQNFLKIVNLLNERGLIDGIGEQGHFYERAPELSVLTSNLDALTATGLPVYITELDLNFADDARQANRMKELFSIFWSNPSVIGVTHWGYLQGSMWQNDAYLVRTDGSARPALTWIECFRAGGTNCTVPAYVPVPRSGDASGITLEAEEYDSAQGLLPAGNMVAYANNGSWVKFDQVTFKDNWNTLNVSYAHNVTSVPLSASIHVGSLDNTPVATVTLPSTGGWSTTTSVSLPWAPLNGVNDVFVRFNGGGFNLDKISFTSPAGLGANVLANGDFETAGNRGGWDNLPWNSGGTIAQNTTRAFTGAASLAQTARTSGGAALYQNLSGRLVPGTTYKVSLWTTINGAASANLNVSRNVSCSDGTTPAGSGMGWLINPKSIPQGTWVELSADLVVPNCPLGWVALWIEGAAAGVDLYLDHASIRPVTSTANTNLITDGTFESGQGGWFSWNTTALAVTATVAHSGTKSLLGSGMKANGAIARDIKALVSPGKKYRATAWASVGSLVAGSGSVKFQTVQKCNGASGDSYPWLGGATVSNGAWAQLSGTIDLSACTTVENLLLFVGADAGELYVDDVTLSLQ